MIGLHGVPLTLLLVEDNPADALLFSEYLDQGDGRIAIASAASLSAALARLSEAPVDVVLLDLTLPDATGVESVERLLSGRAYLPIVILTGAEDEELALRCIAAGASDYLFKSELRPQSLRRAVGYSMSRRHEAQVRELSQTLIRLRRLVAAGAETSVTATMAGVGPLQVMHPGVFRELTVVYRALIDRYLAHVLYDERKPGDLMELTVTRLGDHGAGARDLIALHLAALEDVTPDLRREGGNAQIVEGRLLALEMMGLLVDYYRSGHRRRTIKGTGE